MRTLAVLAIALAAYGCRELNPEFTDESVDTGDTSIDTSSSSSGASSSSSSTDPITTSSSTSESSSSSSSSSSTSSDAGSGSASSSSSSSSGTTSACPDGETECFGVCTDLMTDREHCGECGNACHPAQETCIRGTCTPD